jgi:hypothetical protein
MSEVVETGGFGYGLDKGKEKEKRGKVGGLSWFTWLVGI